MHYKIAAVVVTYNRKELLKESIESLINQDKENFDLDIIIIDNNSNDGTYEMIKNIDDKSIFYHNTGENLGGAGGFNFGIKEAMNKEYDYLWIMDDDTIPDKNALLELVRIIEKNIDFGFLSSYVYWCDKNTCKMNIPDLSVPLLWNEFEKFDAYGLLPCTKTSFVSCLIPTKYIIKFGLPISEFIIWCDDVEYTSRIAKEVPSYFVSKSKVLHKMKNNNPALIWSDEISRLNRYKLKYRNQYYIARRDKSIKKYYYKLLKDILSIIKLAKSHKIKRIKCIVSGWLKGLSFHPKVEYIRKMEE